MYQSAERYLKEHLGKEKVLKPKVWKAEVADPTQKKSRLYSSLQTLKAEVQEAEAVKVRGTGGTAGADQSQDAEQTA